MTEKVTVHDYTRRRATKAGRFRRCPHCGRVGAYGTLPLPRGNEREVWLHVSEHTDTGLGFVMTRPLDECKGAVRRAGAEEG